MIKSKYVNLYICAVIMVAFTIGYFITVNKISYAFVDENSESIYENKINLIKKSAEKYAENNVEIFKEKKSVYITVSDLVSKNYILPDDEEGNVFDPTSSVKKLNDLKMRITNENDKITVKVISS